MRKVDRILVIQTAFIGDVVLTLPLVQVLKEFFATAKIDLLVVPRSADLCRNHPALHETIVFDKRGSERGIRGVVRLARRLRQHRYDLAVVPHRSLRSALLPWLAGIPLRIGFRRSSGRILYSKAVRYDPSLHEIERNLSLLEAIGIREVGKILPTVHPSETDRVGVDRLLQEMNVPSGEEMIALAPGTIWNTKRWLKERFAELAGRLAATRNVVLVGGPEDADLCAWIRTEAGSPRVYSFAGKLSILESAELLRRCRLLVSNDSAPMHLAVAVGTPVAAIFGATVPEFGFAPAGPDDAIVEVRGLRCRPCSIHGGERCPITTFECMNNITTDRVESRVLNILERTGEGESP